ncbi:MAG: Ig-like domain-containing protein, partial [Planctomycetota bacterium]
MNPIGLIDSVFDVDGDALSTRLAANAVNGTPDVAANGSFTYSPASSFFGTDVFSYEGGDGTLWSNAASVFVNVEHAPVAVGDSFSTDEDISLPIAISALLVNDSDFDGGTVSLESFTPPTFGSLVDDGNGNLTYTPVPNYNGTDSFTYVATDGEHLSNVVTVSLSVTATNDLPTANDANYVYVWDAGGVLTVSSAAGVLANDYDVDGDPLTVTNASPANVGTANVSSDGSFTYEPPDGFGGTASFTYTANDATGDSAAATVSIQVTHRPVALGETYAVTEDIVFVSATSVLANDADADGDTLTVELGEAPLHGQLALEPDGNFTYTPDDDFSGTDQFIYRATDSLSASEWVTVLLDVQAVNDAPLSTNDAFNSPEDEVLHRIAPGVLGNDSDPEGATLTAHLHSAPDPRLAFNSDGSFTFTPESDSNTPFVFEYYTNDGELDSPIARVTLSIDPVNDQPVALPDTYAVDEDTPLVVTGLGVLENDSDVDNNLSELVVTELSAPGSGSLSLNADGTFTYLPEANFTGEVTFTYKVNDGEADSLVADATIMVSPVNDAPVATGDQLTGTEDTPEVMTVQSLTANDFDLEGQSLAVELYTNLGLGIADQNGLAVDNGDGTITFTPHQDFVGVGVFHYRVTDGELFSDVGQVQITFSAVNDAPVGSDDPATGVIYETLENTTLEIDAANGVLINDTDVEADALTAQLTSSGAGEVDLSSDGSFVYTPPQFFFGEDSFTYQPVDGSLTGSEATATITVINTNDPPIAGNDFFSIPEDGTITRSTLNGVLENDIDWDGDLLTIEEFNPMGQYLNLGPGGEFSYTPPADFNGVRTFYYRTNDGTIDSNDATIQITVTPVNDAPVAYADNYSVSENNTLVIDGFGVGENDIDVDGDDLTYQVIDAPEGQLTFSPDGTFEYVPAAGFIGLDSFTYQASDGVSDSNVATVTVEVVAPKFFVVDATSDSVYRYGASTNFIDSESLESANSNPTGTASDLAGHRIWVVNDSGSDADVFIYDEEGQLVGEWNVPNVVNPVGIATDEIGVWIVDNDSDSIHFFDAGASVEDGTHFATYTLPLDPQNSQPTGLTTDGSHLWVTDDGVNRVFVYDMAGISLGSWRLDVVNQSPVGITLDPSGGNDLWVVDQDDLSIFRYALGRTFLSGDQVATGASPLAASNADPQGIADPPAEYSFFANHDSFISRRSSSRNYNSYNFLNAINDHPDIQYPYLKFDLSSLSGAVTSARLEFTV